MEVIYLACGRRRPQLKRDPLGSWPNMNSQAPMCRTIAVTAWLAAVAWFAIVVIGSWGFVLAGLAWWSIVGGPLALATLVWLRSAGAPPARGIVIAYGIGWVALLAVFAVVAISGDSVNHQLDAVVSVANVVALLLPVALLTSVLAAVFRLASVTDGPTA